MTRPAALLLGLILCACGGSSTDDGGGTGGIAGAGTGGATGGSAGATGGSPGTGGVAGAGAVAGTGGGGGECASLLDQHSKAVAETKSCTLGDANACTAAVDTSIASCGYYQYGDASNTSAFDELKALKAQWKALSCVSSPGGCALGGFPPVTAECTANGMGGTTGTCATK